MLTVLLARHADIDVPPSPGSPGDPPLNAAGRTRALALAHVAGAVGISAIFTSQYARTKQTVEPLAARLRLLPREATPTLIADVLSNPDGTVVFIAGHSNTVPQMIAALGVHRPVPHIGERDFDNLFVVTTSPMGSGTLVCLKYGRESS